MTICLNGKLPLFTIVNLNVCLHQVPGLAKKADTIRKMGTLLGKLIAKFPQSIKQVKDPQQLEMERMMKEARDKPDAVDDDSEGNDADDLGTDEL